MAFNDPIDQLIDQHEAALLMDVGAKRAARKTADVEDLRQLERWDYQPPMRPPLGLGGEDPFGTDWGLKEDVRQQEKARTAAILADDPYAMEHWWDQADPLVQAEYLGVDVSRGATPEAKRLIDKLPNDLSTDTNTINKILRRAYYQAHNIPIDYDYNVRVEPKTQRLIFNDPANNNKPTFIHKPGIQKEDWAAFIKPLGAEIAGGVAGGLAGAAIGSIIGPAGTVSGATGGAIIGETAATFLYRLNDYNTLQEQGLLPADYDVVSKAMKDAGMTALFSLGGVATFKVVKMAMGLGGVGKRFRLNKGEFLEAFEKLKANGQETAAKFRTDATELRRAGHTQDADLLELQAKTAEGHIDTLTSPQVIMQADAEGLLSGRIKSRAYGIESGLRREATRGGGGAEELAEQYARQQEQLKGYAVEAFDVAGVPVGAAVQHAGARGRKEVGMQLQRLAQQGIDTNPIMVEANQTIQNLGQQADDIFMSIGDATTNPVVAGANIRKTFEEAHEKAGDIVNEIYDQAAKQAGFDDGRRKPYDYTNLAATTQRLLNRNAERTVPDIRFESLLRTIIQRTTGTGRGRYNKGHETAKQDLAQIRAEIRRRVDRKEPLGDLPKLLEAAIQTRTAAFAPYPEADKLIRAADQEYSQFVADFDNNLVGGLLRRQEASKELYDQGDKQAYDSFIGFLRSNLKVLDDGTIDSPEYINKVLLNTDHTTGLLSLKNILRNEFKNKVFQQTDQGLKPASSTAHREFMEQNSAVLQKFFSEEELAQFANTDVFLRQYRTDLAAAEATKARFLDSTHLTDLATTKNPELIFNRTWKPGEYSGTLDLNEILVKTGDTKLVDAYKAYILKDFMANTQISSKTGTTVFSPDKVDTYIANHGDALNLWLGEGFSRDLTFINDKMKIYQDMALPINMKDADTFERAANALARAYVGLFTTPGRVLTAVKTIYGGAASNQVLRLLSDPEYLYGIIKRDEWLRNPAVRGAVRELGRVFYREAVEPPDFAADPAEQTLEQQLGVPGAQEFNLGGHVVKNLGNIPLRYGFK